MPLTLAGAFNAVANSDSLAVAHYVASELAQARVNKVLKVGHGRYSYEVTAGDVEERKTEAKVMYIGHRSSKSDLAWYFGPYHRHVTRGRLELKYSSSLTLIVRSARKALTAAN